MFSTSLFRVGLALMAFGTVCQVIAELRRRRHAARRAVLRMQVRPVERHGLGIVARGDDGASLTRRISA